MVCHTLTWVKSCLKHLTVKRIAYINHSLFKSPSVTPVLGQIKRQLHTSTMFLCTHPTALFWSQRISSFPFLWSAIAILLWALTASWTYLSDSLYCNCFFFFSSKFYFSICPFDYKLCESTNCLTYFNIYSFSNYATRHLLILVFKKKEWTEHYDFEFNGWWHNNTKQS